MIVFSITNRENRKELLQKPSDITRNQENKSLYHKLIMYATILSENVSAEA